LDAGVAALKQTKIHLKHYRQSVLKAAVEGKLTEKWRQEHGDRIEPASVLLEKIASRQDAKDAKKRTMPPIDTRNLPEIPEGWVWTRMIDVSKKITDGEHLRPRMLSEGVAFLSAKDVRDDRIIFEEKLFVSQTDALKYRQRCNPVRDDILLVSRGATVGRTSIVNTDRIFCLLGSVILIKPSVIILPKYLSLILKTPSIQKNLIELSGSTAQQAIYIRDLQNQPIPFPPLVEQEQIVAEVERRLSVADELEKTVGTALKQAERLRQSILKRAFEGKLVLQDPNDPPAIELLEWIKAEKKKRND
jgi:type I restriction enzyme S subunit